MKLADRIKDWGALLEGGLTQGRPPRYPTVAVELAPDAIIGVRLAVDRKSRALVVRQVETRPVPPGAVEPSLIRPNIVDEAPVRTALAEVLAKLAAPDHRVSILIPDHVARTAILTFSALPRTRRELVDLVRFRMAKSLPFKADEAAMDLMVLSGSAAARPGPAGASVLAVFIHRAILDQYERLLAANGYWPGLVGLSTFELHNLFRPRLAAEGGTRDALLLNVTPFYLALLIFSAGSLVFYRCKAHPAGVGTEEEVKAVARELYTSLAFYQEKLLGRGLDRAFLRATGLPRDLILEAVTKEAGCAVEWLEMTEALPVAGTVVLDEEGASRAAPAVGAVAGRRR